jgi:nicotinate-nucleotide adenylyltransferase
MARNWTMWRPPALVLLELPPDPTSATALRAADPDWHEAVMKSLHTKAVRDGVTRRPLT